MNKNFFELIETLFRTFIFYCKFLILGVNFSPNYKMHNIKAFGFACGKVKVRGKLGAFRIGSYLRLLGDCLFIFTENAKGYLKIGDAVIIEESVTIAPRNGEIIIGDNSFIGPGSLIQAYKGANIYVGNNVLIAKDVVILSTNHDLSKPRSGFIGEIGSDVVIGDNVWIGTGVKVLSGVTIGSNSVIAAGAVVTKDVDSYSLYTGIPAVKKKSFIN